MTGGYTITHWRKALRAFSPVAPLILIAAFVFVGIVPAEAKRSAPKPVISVVAGAVRYSAPTDSMGVVLATDVRTHKELWRRRIYRVLVNPFLERDIQDVFITSLSVAGRSLFITDERGRQFVLDCTTKAVRRRK